jgi:hypothetical protein
LSPFKLALWDNPEDPVLEAITLTVFVPEGVIGPPPGTSRHGSKISMGGGHRPGLAIKPESPLGKIGNACEVWVFSKFDSQHGTMTPQIRIGMMM